MLLLVLILVVIAFGLLVVALLTGSVLWAWVSVGVSVVAAVVLLIDWLQRRSAVKAGTVAPASPPPARPTPTVDLDPATEILPVVPASERRGTGPDGPVVDRTEQVQDAQQTVVMPVVQPSGSTARPSGAEDTVTSSGGVSSPSVTKSGAASPPSTAPGDGADDVTRTTPRAPAAASGDTISISKDSLPRGALTKEPVPANRAPASSETQSSGAGGESDAPRPSLSKGDGPDTAEGDDAAAARQPAEPSPAADVTEVVRPERTPERGDAGPGAAASAGRGSSPVEAAPSGSDPTVVTSLAAVTGSRPDPVVDTPTSSAGESGGATAGAAAARAQDPTSDVEKTVKVQALTPKKAAGDVGAPATPPVQAPPPVQPPPAPEAPTVASTPERAAVDKAAAAEPTIVVPPPAAEQAQRPPARNDVDLFAPVAEPAAPVAGPPPSEPPGPLGEAPEEQSDPIAAEIVSGLDDEVVVVDEQPRYHVPTCRALVSTPVIPLPVREAVELGFTPCGWCSPERTLAGQHRTPAR